MYLLISCFQKSSPFLYKLPVYTFRNSLVFNLFCCVSSSVLKLCIFVWYPC